MPAQYRADEQAGMKRRHFLSTFTASAAALWPALGHAQEKPIPVVGILDGGDPGPLLIEFRRGLRDLGYVEGQNIQIEVRSAAGKSELLRGLAEELVRRKVDVIVARLTPPVRAAQEATQTIPIVMAPAGAPLETGLIASLSRPGGNITGLSITSVEASSKRLQLMREMLPSLHRVAMLANAADPISKSLIAEAERAGPSLGLQINPILVNGSQEIETAFRAMDKERVGAVIMQSSLPEKLIVVLALKHRLPLISTTRSAVDGGALMSYSGRLADAYRKAAVYVDKILRGAKPTDLPVEQPTKFELVINLKTAKALGVAVPPALLARADEVIE
jgi:putative tryptophan/tyrosine transport system substrate-binding protein